MTFSANARLSPRLLGNARVDMDAEARRLTDLAEVSEQRYKTAMSELTASKSAVDKERSQLFKDTERLKVEKAVVEARADRLDRELAETKTTRPTRRHQSRELECGKRGVGQTRGALAEEISRH